MVVFLYLQVKVLKQQLLNHSYIHSKESKIAEMREKQFKNGDLSSAPQYVLFFYLQIMLRK